MVNYQRDRRSEVPYFVWNSVERFFDTPHDRPPKYVFMITVYLDESRQDDPDSVMAVAGFYGDQAQWNALVPDWKTALGKRRTLHMSNLRMHSQPKRAKRLLDRLGPLPYKHGLRPIHGAVKASDYLDLLSERSKKELAGYSICLSTVMAALNHLVPLNESIKIVCEMQNQYREDAERMFRAVRIAAPSPLKPYFSGIEFIPKDSSILTQPGDFLAYAITHRHRDPQSLKSQLCLPIFGPTDRVEGWTLPRETVREILMRIINRQIRSAPSESW